MESKTNPHTDIIDTKTLIFVPLFENVLKTLSRVLFNENKWSFLHEICNDTIYKLQSLYHYLKFVQKSIGSIITIFVLGFAEVFSPSMRNDIFSYFLKKVLHSYPMCVLRMHICTQPILAHIIVGSGIAHIIQN